VDSDCGIGQSAVCSVDIPQPQGLFRKDVYSGQLVLKRRFLYSLIAVSRKHPATYEEFMSNKLARITENLDDEQVGFIFGLLGLDERVWRWLGQASRLRIESFISKLKSREHPSEVINRFSVVGVLNIPQLKVLFLETFKDLSIHEQLNIIAQTPHPEFVEESLKLYGYAGSFRGAEELGTSVIIPMIPYFSHEDILEILKITQKNGQIWAATGIRDVIEHLFDSTSEYYSETRDGWQEFVDFLKEKNYLDWYQGVVTKLEQKVGIVPSITAAIN